MTNRIRLFCFGLGYSAERLCAEVIAAGGLAGGTARDSAKAITLRAQGFDACVFSDAAAVAARLSAASHVLISIPPEGSGDPVLNTYSHLFEPARPRWLGYLSTTGVYGDHGGDWVDEQTPLAPRSERAQRRVEAEARWRALAQRFAFPLYIFRLPGIYGPGRSAFDALRTGTARRIDKPGQMFSRIHVDDIASALCATFAKNLPGAYNVSDDEPAPQHAVIAYAAELIGIPAPPLEPFAAAKKTMSAMAQSFYGESKRVQNAKLKQIFGWRLRYPSYREGLKAILAGS